MREEELHDPLHVAQPERNKVSRESRDPPHMAPPLGMEEVHRPQVTCLLVLEVLLDVLLAADSVHGDHAPGLGPVQQVDVKNANGRFPPDVFFIPGKER
jgi:hypothetical protein